ncbi:uncharacterized protein Dana_GF14681 [Drosophila ananassae]|uniref:Uncharacterized protein n=2 Tax=Drosophila ananassae TaxID=7217 RepID=B3MP05_DROAN|nr:uncharacterized protein LOC6497502 isoform X1 [Drosophila ananassae]EDV31171.2 uncharacterized protein Dana_GF14681 [Drosophila ananassae]
MGLLRRTPLELPTAKWYRGLSLLQIEAANDLADAAKFDLAVNRSHRTRDCLMRLGLRPLPKPSQLTQLVKISRAQVLALLYFVFQKNYNIDQYCGKYSVNAQLLLSALAYLDLPATFKALDQILPLHETNTVTETTEKEKYVKQTVLPERRILRPIGGPVSPYFQKQPRPKIHRQENRFVTRPPPFTVEIPHESKDIKEIDNHWFSDYKFQPLYRKIQTIIKLELRRLFDKLDEAPQDSVKESTSKELCSFHEETRSLERQAFLVDQRNRYLEMIDVGAREKQLTKQRIIKHLNRDVDEYLKKFADKGWSPGVPAIRKTECCACSGLVHVSLESPPKVLSMEGERTRLYESNGPQFRLCGGEVSKRSSVQQPNDPLTSYFRSPKLHVPYVFNYSKIFASDSSKSLNTTEIIGTGLVKSLMRSSDDDEQIGDQVSQRSKQTHRSSTRLISKSVLRSHTNQSSCSHQSSRPIRGLRHKQCPNSDINKGIDQESHSDEKIHSPIMKHYIDQALCRCVRRIFEKSLLVANRDSDKLQLNRLSYPQHKLIDPDDDRLMDQMLKDAFRVLRKDKNLVLATLPDGHQIPEMREWIKRRYGKQYGLQSRKMYFKTSAKMVKNLDLIEELRRVSAIIDPLLIRYAPISFGMYHSITKSAKLFKEKVREDVFQLMLQRTRVCWQVLHGLRAKNNTSLREIFFTYMPSSVRHGGPTMSQYFTDNPREDPRKNRFLNWNH